MLPKDAKPVTTWPTEDEAFRSVAEGIRRAVENIAGRRAIGQAPNAGYKTEDRALEGAISAVIPVGEVREVLSMVRLTDSSGLRGVLNSDHTNRDYSFQPSDIRSEQFYARYAAMADGELVSPEYRLSLHAPSLRIEDNDRKFVLSPLRDSAIFKLFVMAEREGEHRIRIGLFTRDWSIAETMMLTKAQRPPGGPQAGVLKKAVATVDLIVRAIARAAEAGQIL